jgi:N6-L-threonylcarbamoyladenine synthase
VVDSLAAHGNPRAVKFTIAKMKGNALDFSFSGLKTAVLRWVESHDLLTEIEARKNLMRGREGAPPAVEEWLAVTPAATLDLLASFQFTVVDELIRHASAAAERTGGVRSLIISGGVACNSGLRAAARRADIGLPVFFPTALLSTDNAVMIAAAALPKFRRGEFAPLSAAAEPNLALATATS